ncbi:hypothetical protein BDZ91DRAFT_747509 [Kalaharituber pfeilii]|nr:hypothetical protein BDZ91DRAFT_747509 [Kalaharituber pfeilii]
MCFALLEESWLAFPHLPALGSIINLLLLFSPLISRDNNFSTVFFSPFTFPYVWNLWNTP